MHEGQNKLLYVSFPVDLGNRQYELRLVSLLSGICDLEVHRFNPATNHANYLCVLWGRLKASFLLRKSIRQAWGDNRLVFIQGLSPALFAMPLTLKGRTSLVVDWTPTIYANLNKSLLSHVKRCLYKLLIKKQKKIYCFTHSAINHLREDYGADESKLVYLPVPFCEDLTKFAPSDSEPNLHTKLLFVGGDIRRKGGDKLIDWFEYTNKRDISLTVVSGNCPNKPIANITYLDNINAGTEQHTKLFAEHDVLVLPTLADSYPVVLAEAAASGLAIVTTKFALGAPEIVDNGCNGFICDSQEEVFDQVLKIASNRELLDRMKRSSRTKMENDFCYEKVVKIYRQTLLVV